MWIDQMDRIQEALGSAAGRTVSGLVADRLAHCLRPTDTVTPAGGGRHEVTVTVEEPGDRQRLRQRFTDVCNEPFEVDGREIWVTILVAPVLTPLQG